MTPKNDKFRTVAAAKQVREGRLAKAQQFLRVADADAICARALSNQCTKATFTD